MFENFLFCLKNGIPVRGAVIGRNTIQNGPYSFTIDTCFTNDCSCYETAIKNLDNEWIVVEHYSSPEEASKGHAKWIKYTSTSPMPTLVDIFSNEIHIYNVQVKGVNHT